MLFQFHILNSPLIYNKVQIFLVIPAQNSPASVMSVNPSEVNLQTCNSIAVPIPNINGYYSVQFIVWTLICENNCVVWLMSLGFYL